MTVNSIKDHLVQIGEKQNDMLTRKLHDVNMRLYNNNKNYNKTIKTIVKLMHDVLYMDFTDYSLLRGISGANVGIPFNIVIVKVNSRPKQRIMLNPVIIKRSKKNIKAESNCGSLLLPENITVSRNETVKVEYYNLSGNKIIENFSREDSGFTIQHEIEHNLGITILDKKID